MQSILFIVNAPPYGNERMLSALRLASTLITQEREPVKVRLFMMSDAVTVGLPQQQAGMAGDSLGSMLEDMAALGAQVRLCRTCMQARGLIDLALLPGVQIGTMAELSEWTLSADKVLTF